MIRKHLDSSNPLHQPPRVVATPAAVVLIAQLQQVHGALLFHQSGGCCDGSVPMCFPVGDFFINETDVLLGEVAACPFYIAEDHFGYWQYAQLILDVENGRGSGFSLENGSGKRFVARVRLFSEEELAQLEVSMP